MEPYPSPCQFHNANEGVPYGWNNVNFIFQDQFYPNQAPDSNSSPKKHNETHLNQLNTKGVTLLSIEFDAILLMNSFLWVFGKRVVFIYCLLWEF